MPMPAGYQRTFHNHQPSIISVAKKKRKEIIWGINAGFGMNQQ
jgi:hypothetical protein